MGPRLAPAPLAAAAAAPVAAGTESLWVDGALVPAGQGPGVPILAHGLQRGAAVFDVGALRPGEGGALLFRPADHVARFLRSAAIVGLEVGWTPAELLDATVRTASAAVAAGVRTALVRWMAFVGSAEPDVVPRPGVAATVAIAVLPTDPAAARPSAVRVRVPSDVRKAGPEVFSPQAKVGASYLGPMLAKRRARAEGYDEVVLLDREGRVAEAPTANVFAVRAGRLVTPPTERVLEGITRDSVLAIARAEGIEAGEEHLRPEELGDADEVFLTATSLPVLAVAEVNGTRMPGGAPGPLTARMAAAVTACERGEDPRFAAWVMPVP